MEPLISIITPTFNRGNTLLFAIQSVYNQGIEDLEFIIMDGGSTDNTIDIIKNYPNIRFFSEPDKGLYFALNKGLKLARGKYIGWLNSDDYFKPDVLAQVIGQLEHNPALMALFASAEISSLENGKDAILVPAIKEGQLFQRATLDSFSLNAAIFRRTAFEQLGGFDTRYIIVSDRDFLFRFGLAGFSYAHTDQVLYVYQSHPSSLTYGKLTENQVLANTEEMHMSLEYLTRPSTPGPDPELCRQWHTRASADATILLIFSGKISAAWQFALVGFQIDKGWLIVFIKLFFLALARKIFPHKFRAKFSRFRYLLTGIR